MSVTFSHRHAWKLLDEVDFAGFAETHSTLGHANAATLPTISKFVWSHGPTRWQAGVAIAVKGAFLQQFNPVDHSAREDIVPGRAAKLTLRGPNGALYLYIYYFPTGTQNEDQEHHIINKLRESLAPSSSVLYLWATGTS